MKVCIECGNTLMPDMMLCLCGCLCQPDEPVPPDHRCHYVYQERRCPLPGTMSHFWYAKGHWYCSGHWFTRDNPIAAKGVLDFAERQHQKSAALH